MKNSISSNQWNLIRKRTDYGNFNDIKQIIHKQETAFAANFENINFVENNSRSQLEVDFELFFTWRLKLIDFSLISWCNGVKVKKLNKIDKLTFEVEAKIWIGPEDDVNILSECDMTGIFTISKKFDRLKDYKFKIEYENKNYIVEKI